MDCLSNHFPYHLSQEKLLALSGKTRFQKQILSHTELSSIHTFLIHSLLQWVGHVLFMLDHWLPKEKKKKEEKQYKNTENFDVLLQHQP